MDVKSFVCCEESTLQKKKKKSEESKLILLYAIENSIADSTVDSFQIHFEVPFFDGC